MTNAIKVLLQMQSGFLQLASTLDIHISSFTRVLKWPTRANKDPIYA
jgi:hypothetical protein